MGMDAADLLIALAESKVFANDLEGVKLGQCAVLVSHSPQEHELTEAERSATELKYDNTICILARGATKVFIRVELPPTAGEGSCPCSPLTLSPRHALTDEFALQMCLLVLEQRPLAELLLV